MNSQVERPGVVYSWRHLNAQGGLSRGVYGNNDKNSHPEAGFQPADWGTWKETHLLGTHTVCSSTSFLALSHNFIEKSFPCHQMYPLKQLHAFVDSQLCNHHRPRTWKLLLHPRKKLTTTHSSRQPVIHSLCLKIDLPRTFVWMGSCSLCGLLHRAASTWGGALEVHVCCSLHPGLSPF